MSEYAGSASPRERRMCLLDGYTTGRDQAAGGTSGRKSRRSFPPATRRRPGRRRSSARGSPQTSQRPGSRRPAPFRTLQRTCPQLSQRTSSPIRVPNTPIPEREKRRGDTSSLAAMELGLDGKVALVTGASKGLGRGIAAALAAEGARVAISSRSKERIDAAAAQTGARLAVAHASADLDGVPHLVARVEAELGCIEILVTNTGGPPPGPD